MHGPQAASRSEWDDRGEQARGRCAASECSTVFNGVQRDAFRSWQLPMVRKGAAGRAGEVEDEGLGMAPCPFGHDVGNDSAVVVRA